MGKFSSELVLRADVLEFITTGVIEQKRPKVGTQVEVSI